MNKEIPQNNLIEKISELLKNARNSVISTVNQTMVFTYYEIGRMIVEEEQRGKERAEYGKQTLKELSARLTKDFGKGFSVENLDRMRYFYKIYSPRISSTLLTISEKSRTASDEFEKQQALSANFNLSWSHYLKLMRIDDEKERRFYEIESYKNNWSLRELQRQYDSALYTRLALSRDKEKVLELSAKGQIFYNRILKCFVLIDLKIGELKHQDIGQMQMYVNYYDREVKLQDENKTIGIILCQDKNEAVVQYTLPENNEQIFASKYMTVLPSKEALKQLLENNEESLNHK